MVQPVTQPNSTALLVTLDRWRHKIPFFWWITYDAAVAVVILVGVAPWSFAFWLGFGTLGIAVVIDTVEFFVKSPWAKARLAETHRPTPFHERLDEDDLAIMAMDDEDAA